MKHWLIIGMLVIMGERWEFEGVIFDGPCGHPKVLSVCESRYYRRVFVIGNSVPRTSCNSVVGAKCSDETEVFTVPIPNSAIKRMTEAEAKKLNEASK